ncbi:MAG: hypothetical protein ACRCT6_07225, partial [Notoacmeibacter sp.]
LVWIYATIVCFYFLLKTWNLRDPIAPLASFSALCLIWDLFFSPGPFRIEFSIKFLILIFTLKLIETAYSRSKSVAAMVVK